jgi:hypothetical protein
MAYDSDRGVVILAGGDDYDEELDTWEWDGVSWSMQPLDGIAGRFGNVMVYHAAGGAAMMHGGYGQTYLTGQFLEYHPPCPGDLDGDCDTDQADLGVLLADWGCTGGNCVGDLDGDGNTGQADLGILLADWGCGT